VVCCGVVVHSSSEVWCDVMVLSRPEKNGRAKGSRTNAGNKRYAARASSSLIRKPTGLEDAGVVVY
jgi:hypothetical protein